MSLEKAAAILDAANKDNPLEPIPGADPDKAVVIPKDQAIPETKFDTKTDSLVETKPKAETPIVDEGIPIAKEPPKEEEKKPETQDQMSRRFAILASKEKAIRREQQRIRAEAEATGTRIQAIENFERFKAQVAENPLLALQELGVTYDQLTKFVLSGKMPNTSDLQMKAMEEKWNSFEQRQIRAEQERRRQAQIAQQKRQQLEAAQTINAFQQEIGEYIKSNAEKYEFINLNEASNLVFHKIEKTFEEARRQGQHRLLSISEASDLVEKELEAQVDKNLKAKKLAQKISLQKEGTKPTQTVQQRTLNNQMTASAPSLIPAQTDRDRMNRALAALEKASS